MDDDSDEPTVDPLSMDIRQKSEAHDNDCVLGINSVYNPDIGEPHENPPFHLVGVLPVPALTARPCSTRFTGLEAPSDPEPNRVAKQSVKSTQGKGSSEHGKRPRGRPRRTASTTSTSRIPGDREESEEGEVESKSTVSENGRKGQRQTPETFKSRQVPKVPRTPKRVCRPRESPQIFGVRPEEREMALIKLREAQQRAAILAKESERIAEPRRRTRTQLQNEQSSSSSEPDDVDVDDKEHEQNLARAAEHSEEIAKLPESKSHEFAVDEPGRKRHRRKEKPRYQNETAEQRERRLAARNVKEKLRYLNQTAEQRERRQARNVMEKLRREKETPEERRKRCEKRYNREKERKRKLSQLDPEQQILHMKKCVMNFDNCTRKVGQMISKEEIQRDPEAAARRAADLLRKQIRRGIFSTMEPLEKRSERKAKIHVRIQPVETGPDGIQKRLPIARFQMVNISPDDLPETPEPCSVCSKPIPLRYMRLHILYHEELDYAEKLRAQAFKCNSCEKGYRTEVLLQMHHRQAHQSTVVMKCSICIKQFKDKATMNKHTTKIHGTVATEADEQLSPTLAN